MGINKILFDFFYGITKFVVYFISFVFYFSYKLIILVFRISKTPIIIFIQIIIFILLFYGIVNIFL